MSLRAQLLKRELESALSHVTAILAAIELQKQTLENLSLLGIIEDREWVDLTEIASDLQVLFYPIAVQKQKSLEIQVGSFCKAHLRRSSTKQILINLIANSLNYCRNQVLVTLWVEGGRAKLTVIDDGPGIPDDLLPYVFDPFVKGENSQGSGLGLAIAKALTLQQDGSIGVKSQDSGCEFVVELC